MAMRTTEKAMHQALRHSKASAVLSTCLRLVDLLLGEVDIASQLPDLHAVRLQALAKVADHLRNQRLHANGDGMSG